MFISCRDVLLVNVFGDLYKGLKELKIDSFELFLDRNMATCFGTKLANQQDRSQFLKELRQQAVKVSAALVASNFSLDTKDEIAYVVNACKVAGELGAKVVRIDTVMRERKGATMKDYVSLAARNIEECLRQTRGLGVSLAMENHGVIANREDFIQGVFEAIKSDLWGLTLDTGNFYWYGYPLKDVYRIIERLSPWVKHTHMKNATAAEELKERQRRPGEIRMSPLSQGDIGLEKVVGLLKQVRYDHDLCIENESLGLFPSERRQEILKEDAAYLQSLISSDTGGA